MDRMLLPAQQLVCPTVTDPLVDGTVRSAPSDLEGLTFAVAHVTSVPDAPALTRSVLVATRPPRDFVSRGDASGSEERSDRQAHQAPPHCSSFDSAPTHEPVSLRWTLPPQLGLSQSTALCIRGHMATPPFSPYRLDHRDLSRLVVCIDYEYPQAPT
jgi:hypothetical protein